MKSNLLAAWLLFPTAALSFTVQSPSNAVSFSQTRTALRETAEESSSSDEASSEKSSGRTGPSAFGSLKRKAKEAVLREYISQGIEDDVMAAYKEMKAKMDSIDLHAPEIASRIGPLQEQLHRRKGTLTVIAEFKRKNAATPKGVIKDFYDPELLSPMFREYGASAIAVLADQQMGGCSYDDLKQFVEEQRRAQYEVPGPVKVINSDLIVDELQIARSKAYGAASCVIPLNVVGDDLCELLLKACHAVGEMEPIVSVSNKEEAQRAIDLGANMISVVGVDGIDGKVAVVDGLTVPEGRTVTKIANILVKKDKNLAEIEEAWAIRDKGFQSAWIGEALYKAGDQLSETPGALIRSMKSKSSLKWASPKPYTGRGEGAREYLGDILM